MLTRRTFTAQVALGAATGIYAPYALSQAGMARIMLGFPPGSTFDAFTRRVAEQLRGKWAPTVLVENKPGAGGQIALTTIRDSASDGTNVLVSPSSLFTVSPSTYKKLPYKNEDFQPLAASVVLEPAIAVGPAVPESVKTLKDFIQWTKDNPASASYGSPATGSMLHLIGAYIGKVSNANWQHVPYRGAPPAIQDLQGGLIPAVVLPIGEFLPFVKTGKVRVLGISSKSPSPFAPTVPTLTQSGIPLSAREWYGFYVSAATPPEAARRLAAYLQVALNQPDMVSWAESVGMQMQYKGPDETAAAITSEMEEWRGIVKATGFTAES